MRFVFVLSVFTVLLLSACGDSRVIQEAVDASGEQHEISNGPWSVKYDPADRSLMRIGLEFESTDAAAGHHGEVDSLNFDNQLPDSLVFNRNWHVGALSVLQFSVTIPDWGDGQLVREAGILCEGASIVRPVGLRSVFLADRSGMEIDQERASVAVEPPPEVNHHMLLYYQQDSTANYLEVIDSLVVSFSESNADSMVFTYIHRDPGSVISSTAGIFRRGSNPDQYICFADSTGIYTGVFRNRFQMNIPYLNSQGRACVQSRLNSAYLSGDGYYPISTNPENYSVKTFLPDSISAWTPLERDETTGEWFSRPGGIVGGLPVAIGNYTEHTLFPRYRLLTLEGSPISGQDSISVERMARVLKRTLDFPSAEFCFVEILNPDGPVVISGFGGMLFSRGALESLADVSLWDEDVANGLIPEGSEILAGAAEGILMQSLQLDPILADMLAAWLPLRYYAGNSEDETGLTALRDAHLKYYFFNTEMLGGNGSTPVVAEYALGDPMQISSPLRSFVSEGKGVIVLEYLYSLRLLNRLPFLLQDFTHASSGNFWLKLSSSLRVYRNTADYDLLRALFYQPGLPQVRVRWWENDDNIFVYLAEIQPGEPFNIEFNQCEMHLADTTFVRPLTPFSEAGLLQCTAGFEGQGSVLSIDLNHTRVIPADMMYERIIPGDAE